MNFGPYSRIVLRYAVGAGMFGSDQIGQSLSANPDLVFVVSLGIGAVVEAAYRFSKRKGWST